MLSEQEDGVNINEDRVSLNENVEEEFKFEQVRKTDLNDEQQQSLEALKSWLETEAPFLSRTDDAFVVMFLFACEFDMEFTKKTIAKYYECRRRIRKWWSSRYPDDDNMQAVYKRKLSVILKDKSPDQTTVFLTMLSRVGPNEGNFDDYFKTSTTIFDIGVRRTNAIRHGVKWIIDCSNYKLWFTLRLLSPINADHFVFSFLLGAPTRIRHVLVLNAPTIICAFYKLMQPFLSQELKDKIVFIGNDWSDIFKYIPHELVPEEYGGSGGPLSYHDDEFLKELETYKEYIVEDNKYGYQEN